MMHEYFSYTHNDRKKPFTQHSEGVLHYDLFKASYFTKDKDYEYYFDEADVPAASYLWCGSGSKISNITSTSNWDEKYLSFLTERNVYDKEEEGKEVGERSCYRVETGHLLGSSSKSVLADERRKNNNNGRKYSTCTSHSPLERPSSANKHTMILLDIQNIANDGGSMEKTESTIYKSNYNNQISRQRKCRHRKNNYALSAEFFESSILSQLYHKDEKIVKKVSSQQRRVRNCALSAKEFQNGILSHLKNDL